ncbi:hypothetical protein STHU_25200 [Allostella humosa]|nr:hypothetical protein STHU_25200 [Stella humosa]
MRNCNECVATGCERIPSVQDPAKGFGDEQSGPVGRSDAAIVSVVLSITDLLTTRGMICLDLADISSVLRAGGPAVWGQGEASGPDRARRAAEGALLDLRQKRLR